MCVASSIVLLVIEIGSLTEPGGYQLSQTGRPASPTGPPASASPVPGLQVRYYTELYMCSGESEVRSSGFHGKYTFLFKYGYIYSWYFNLGKFLFN